MYSVPPIGPVVAIWAALCWTSVAAAQPTPEPPAPRALPALGFGPLELLRRDDVRAELEMMDDQVEQLEQVAARAREKVRDIVQQLRGLSGEERGIKMREMFGQFSQETQAAIEKLLLPHQTERLRQIELQIRLRSGLSQLLSNTELISELGLNETQQAELGIQAEAIDRQTQEEISRLRQQALERFLALLDPEQQQRFRRLVGEPFQPRSAPGQ